MPPGAVGPSTQVYNSLDLKQIQLDSLGYLMARHLQSCAHFDSSSDLFDNALRFYGGNYKEVSDLEDMINEITFVMVVQWVGPKACQCAVDK